MLTGVNQYIIPTPQPLMIVEVSYDDVPLQVNSLEKFSWFHGNTTRAEAELMLSRVIYGSFLVRESESKPGVYVLSVCVCDGRHVVHFRINTDPQTSQYFLDGESKFENLPELIVHYSVELNLRYPVSNPCPSHIQPFPRSEVNQSENDMRKKLGEAQYEDVTKKSGIFEAEN